MPKEEAAKPPEIIVGHERLIMQDKEIVDNPNKKCTASQKSGLFCEQCGKEIEIKLVKETQKKSKIEKGLVIVELVEVIVEKQESLICSTCGGVFCLDCVNSYYKNKEILIKTNICIQCQEKADEKKKRACNHEYRKRFVRRDKYFDYYEMVCHKCGNKKGIAEPIKIIKYEPETGPKQKSNTPRSRKHKTGLSKIVESIKGLLDRTR